MVNNDLGESQVIRAASFHIIFLLSWNTLPSPPSKLKCDAGLPHTSPPPCSLLLMPLRPFSIVALQVVELKPGGRDIPVTTSNRISYIHLVADYRLNKQVSPKSLFLPHIYFVLLSKAVALFTPIFCYVVILHLAWLWQTWEVNVISLLPFVLDSSSLCSIQGRLIRCHQPRLAKDVWSQRTTGDFVS